MSAPTGRAAVVDFRRPVVGLPRELLEGVWDEVYALTPLSAWLLEQAGVRFSGNDALVDAGHFHLETSKNYGRLVAAFERAFGAERDSWLGLIYPLNLMADYAVAEELRWAKLADRRVEVFSDLAHRSRASASYEDHVYNRSALYFGAVEPERHHLVRSRSETVDRLLNRARRLTAASLTRRLFGLTRRGGGPGLVTRFGYDWGGFRAALKGRVRPMSPEQLAAEALRAGGAELDRRPVERMLEALKEELAPVLSRTLPGLLSVASSLAERYALSRQRLSEHMPALISRHDLKGALSTFCASDEDYLVNFLLKRHGRRSVFYQHGGYIQRFRLTYPAEVAPATDNLVFGSDDAAFVSGLRKDDRVFPVGSPLLARLRPARRVKGRFLYVLLLNPGNALLTESPLSRHPTDHAALFLRHRRVLELFERHPALSLVVRPHPSHFTWGLYEPLKEFVAARRIRNVSFDQSAPDPDAFLSGYEGVVMDYPCTALLQALAKGQNVACHIGDPYHVPEDAEPVLRRAVACASDDDGFLALLERWVAEGPKVDEAARTEFLARFGDSGRPRVDVVERIIEEVLA